MLHYHNRNPHAYNHNHNHNPTNLRFDFIWKKYVYKASLYFTLNMERDAGSKESHILSGSLCTWKMMLENDIYYCV